MREPMKTIKSFQVDHTKLQKGLYLSRVDGDCVCLLYTSRCV